MKISGKIIIIALAICLVGALAVATATDQEADEMSTANEAWQKLMDGNARFVNNEPEVKDFVSEREAVVAGQSPFATVITCSDSRVPPEYIFDQGIGDVFVIRVAGNVVDSVVLGSVEYGVEHLHTPIFVVLGHQSCGAVTAAVQGGAEGNIESIMDEIEPAVEAAEKTGKTEGELVDEAIDQNIDLVIESTLEGSPITKELVEEGKLVIVGAKYYLDTGEVEQLSWIDAAALAEMEAEESEETKATVNASETKITVTDKVETVGIPGDIIPEDYEPASDIPGDIIPEDYEPSSDIPGDIIPQED